MKAIFLDIDGVLNDRSCHPNGYCGTKPDNVYCLNLILREHWDAKLVISSSWRYGFLKGWHTLDGVEHLLLTHGVDCFGRFHGCTDADPIEYAQGDGRDWQQFSPEQWHEWGLTWRVGQIEKYVADHGITNFVILDDLPLDHPNLVQTQGHEGLTNDVAGEAIRRLDPEIHGVPTVDQLDVYFKAEAKNPGVLLAVRVGDYYEFYGESAKIVAGALSLTLTGREFGERGRIPMTGVPFHSAAKYVASLAAQGFRVGLCDAIETWSRP